LDVQAKEGNKSRNKGEWVRHCVVAVGGGRVTEFADDGERMIAI
jgi:hypothetical protein